MKFLVVCSLFPPDALGGAELSAYECARWLLKEGHEVSVLTTAKSSQDELKGETVNGMKVWRIHWPRRYPIHLHEHQSRADKTFWHLQDHFDPANPKLVSQVVHEVEPDFIHIHIMAGLGHNALSAFNKLEGVPATYFLHDVGLACIRSNMYKSGANCDKKCKLCSVSSWLKFRHLKNTKIYNFVSPSAANLETLKALTPIGPFRSRVIPNFDFEQALPRVSGEGAALRFIYVGRINATKGVAFLLGIFSDLANEGHSFSLKIVGGGPDEQKLRRQYEQSSWVSFAGRVTPAQVRVEMSNADIFCLPSLWRENHPGVVRHALRAGVPALVSDSGGSAEMIDDGQSGLVLPAGDVHAWKVAIKRLILEPCSAKKLQQGATAGAARYAVDAVGIKMREVIAAALSAI